jgi:hypothetical protein
MHSRNAVRLATTLLLLVLCVQIWTSIRTNSPTFDEPYHVARSYVYLKTGDSALLELGGHPPFANMISVAPLLLQSGIVLPAHEPGWPDATSFKDLFRVADQFLWRLGNDAERITLWARLPMMLLSAALAALVFLWAKQLQEASPHPATQSTPAFAALLALLLYAFDPNLIAHSSVVTTDLGATFFVFVCVYSLWRFCQQPSWAWLILTGVVFGLAQASKFSSLFLAPILLVLLTLWARDATSTSSLPAIPGQRRFGKRPWLQRYYTVLGLLVIICIIGFVVLWAVYGFRVRPLLPKEDSHPLLDSLLPLGSSSLKRVTYALAENLPVPAPAYFDELSWLRRYANAGHPSFLMGAHGVQGWWFYFPLAFAIKTPIPLLILLLAAVALSLKNRQDIKDEFFLLVPMALFFLSSMFSSIDIGYRNILPVLPFAFVYVSKVVARVGPRVGRMILIALCFWYVVGTIALSPHYLAYFNEFVGGPDNGYRYLVDSNLDWGQDLGNLKKYLDAQGIGEVYLSYFGTADPGYYGLLFREMPAAPPAPDARKAYYAISATNLQGVYGEGGATHWLTEYQPQEKVGFSIFIYCLP